jgi:hypothetical protein
VDVAVCCVDYCRVAGLSSLGFFVGIASKIARLFILNVSARFAYAEDDMSVLRHSHDDL